MKDIKNFNKLVDYITKTFDEFDERVQKISKDADTKEYVIDEFKDKNIDTLLDWCRDCYGLWHNKYGDDYEVKIENNINIIKDDYDCYKKMENVWNILNYCLDYINNDYSKEDLERNIELLDWID